MTTQREKETTMSIELKLVKRTRHVYETYSTDNNVYIDFYKILSTGEWKTNYIPFENDTFYSRKSALWAVKYHLHAGGHKAKSYDIMDYEHVSDDPSYLKTLYKNGVRYLFCVGFGTGKDNDPLTSREIPCVTLNDAVKALKTNWEYRDRSYVLKINSKSETVTDPRLSRRVAVCGEHNWYE